MNPDERTHRAQAKIACLTLLLDTAHRDATDSVRRRKWIARGTDSADAGIYLQGKFLRARRYSESGFGRRPSSLRRISVKSRRGIATSASWNVTDRPWPGNPRFRNLCRDKARATRGWRIGIERGTMCGRNLHNRINLPAWRKSYNWNRLKPDRPEL